MTSVTATELRVRLGDLLTRVEQGEQVTITRHGRAVAALVRPDALRSSRTGEVFDAAAHLHELIAHASRADLGKTGGLSLDRADELVREMRKCGTTADGYAMRAIAATFVLQSGTEDWSCAVVRARGGRPAANSPELSSAALAGQTLTSTMSGA